MTTSGAVEFELSSGGLVIDDAGRVLMIKVATQNEIWTFPKGRIDRGETSEDAAVREVREETGWRCEVLRTLAPVTYWFQRRRGDGSVRVKKTVHWFLMRPLEEVGVPDPKEVAAVTWLPVADAPSRLTYASDRKLLESRDS